MNLASINPRIMASPALSGTGSLPYYNAPSITDFEIEGLPTKSGVTSRRVASRRDQSAFDEEYIFRDSVSRVLAAKSRPFTVSGHIPYDPSVLVLFFRSKVNLPYCLLPPPSLSRCVQSGVTHSLDFPIDVEINTPPALDVLIAACVPMGGIGILPERETLIYPPNLPLTTTLDISNHPIMETIRNTLFPLLPNGHYLTSMYDKLDVIVSGGGTGRQVYSARNDGRVATIFITLPVRFRGGTLVIRDTDGSEERYFGRGGKSGDLEWTAFLADCEYEVETVHKGCKVSISYGVYPRTYGPQADPLIAPSENFMDLFSPILNATRGRKIAFYLLNEYGVNPSEALADSLVPYVSICTQSTQSIARLTCDKQLKGGDSLLYHTLVAYKLNPELHWTAGGYIWPVDRTVNWDGHSVDYGARRSFGAPKGVPAVRGPFGISYAPDPQAEAESLRLRIESSGAIPIFDADVFILTDWESPGPAGKERVPFVADGELQKLVVNVLLVTYVP
jgi:hypothetical protein